MEVEIICFTRLLASAVLRATVYILFLNSKMSISVKGTIDLASAFLRRNRNGWQVSFTIHCRMLPNLRHVKMWRNVAVIIEKMRLRLLCVYDLCYSKRNLPFWTWQLFIHNECLYLRPSALHWVNEHKEQIQFDIKWCSDPISVCNHAVNAGNRFWNISLHSDMLFLGPRNILRDIGSLKLTLKK